jgi:cellulose biosynthesis protein BcsQ
MEKGLIHPMAKILGEGIRNDVKMGECIESHLPILLYDESSNAAQDYLETTRQFLQHFEALP